MKITPSFPPTLLNLSKEVLMRSVLLWMIGIPIPLIILYNIFF